jgi:hypothetical protein
MKKTLKNWDKVGNPMGVAGPFDVLPVGAGAICPKPKRKGQAGGLEIVRYSCSRCSFFQGTTYDLSPDPTSQGAISCGHSKRAAAWRTWLKTLEPVGPPKLF